MGASLAAGAGASAAGAGASASGEAGASAGAGGAPIPGRATDSGRLMLTLRSKYQLVPLQAQNPMGLPLGVLAVSE